MGLHHFLGFFVARSNYLGFSILLVLALVDREASLLELQLAWVLTPLLAF